MLKKEAKKRDLKDWVNFNKELLISEFGALIGGPLFAQVTSLTPAGNIIIALAASVGDYLGYTLFYSISSFFDNRKLYWSKKKARIKVLYFRDIGKFILGAALVDIIYYGLRGVLTFLLLTLNLAPYLAAFVSQLTTLIIYFLLMNIMGKVVGIVHKKKDS